ncbi:MAG: GNAT family N-acetyltransferase [Actinomycetota bacterium]|nr:GNAT family N-acetyltransferase [Actinomycetota bacterium]
MKRTLAGGFELDDDTSRVDIDVVHRYLTNDSYWAKGRSRETVERLVRDATRIVGLYAPDGNQAGFARVVTDEVSFGWLADVFVLPDYRHRGLGVELVREAVDGHPVQPRQWLLGTLDAHTLYEKIGFGPPSDRIMHRRQFT